ncbi:type I methionyl aminopeptidase [Neomoorella thermoacetica]|uniref:Methionine aminopeptidase n=3 Tax=Neomoorella thermoacetica TaxID=1525 RepID=A0A1D7XEW8_NEOTH|nr:type I methionyl aminopeptidase [Moorella thermoacetica]AKX95298.1 methionine aminopeptidase 1 [Moorella thermoacetica]AKX97923.1 methionine aminopeptidase 1 [Moorella thermoacetica]AOQ25412.1 Methionine aminopeptidase 1 [Moorella thermoacetica]APC09636.1 methionine aminopeptidase 1 [Moorella thermoacetica]OIQ10102.1 methionine aminopeptidase 1 [Moorella thermoacetica]
MIILKSRREIALMREAGRIVAGALAKLQEHIAPGITTGELDRIAEEYIRRHDAVPAFKGYHGFPASICASVNEEVVHGIPGLKKLVAGDIISIDIGVVKNGYVGDSAATFPVGDIDSGKKQLLAATQAALQEGIKKAVVGNRLTDISHAIQAFVEARGFSVVRDYVGHGVGRAMHEDPQVPNFGPPGYGPRLRVGMVLAIEPMVNAGTHEVYTLPNRWTVVTRDGQPSAHFEHTVAITENGPEILTLL